RASSEASSSRREISSGRWCSSSGGIRLQPTEATKEEARMGTSGVDFYTKVHKGLRASLFRLSQQAGSIDYAQPEAAVSLSQSLEAVLGQLTAHAGHEEKFIHPLLSHKLDANPFDAEHARLEAEQRRLAVLMRDRK